MLCASTVPVRPASKSTRVVWRPRVASTSMLIPFSACGGVFLPSKCSISPYRLTQWSSTSGSSMSTQFSTRTVTVTESAWNIRRLLPSHN